MEEGSEKKRPIRVGNRIKEEISRMLLKGIKDPRLEMVNITNTKVSGDLRHAKVYFMVTRDSYDVDEIIKGLNSAKSYIRRELLKALRMKFVPELKFFYDDSLEYGNRIEKIFKKIKNENSQAKDQ